MLIRSKTTTIVLAMVALHACRQTVQHAGAEREVETQRLLVSGTVSETAVTLSPAYFVESAPVIPNDPGPFVLEGFDAAGRSLFHFAFIPTNTDHAPAVAQFTFAIPLSTAARDALTMVRVTGPGRSAVVRSSVGGRRPLLAILSKAVRDTTASGHFSLRRVTDATVRLQYDARTWSGVMVRDPDTHEVLTFSSGGTALVATSRSTLQLVFSDGVQSASQIVAVGK